MVINTNRLRQINIELVRQVIKENEVVTKNKLSNETGLSVSSCRNILNDLLATGEVVEVDFVDSNGGRPSRGFAYNGDFAYIGVIYFRLEGQKQIIFYAVKNMTGKVIEEKSLDVDRIDFNCIDGILSYITVKYPKLRVLSIGVPGVVLNGNIELCDIKNLSYYPLKKEIEEKYNIEVIIENDVNSCAIGYYQHNNLGHVESSVYVYFPVNGSPGTGIIILGRILRGDNNFAGEVGFLPLGVEYKDQGSLQNSREDFLHYVSKIVLSINSIINPANIVLSWELFDQNSFQLLNEEVTSLSLEGHTPQLTFNTDIHEDFVNGLSFLALKEMSCKIEVTER